MRAWAGRALAVTLGVGALVVGVPGLASAHPLGNFTVNRFSGLVIGTDAVTIDHVLDVAEIPTAQRRPVIDTSGDRKMSPAELRVYAKPTCASEAAGLSLTVGSAPVDLTVVSATARTAPGQADLPVLRVECELRGDAPGLSEATRVEFGDSGAGNEVGWKEVIAQGDGMTLSRSDVPATSRSERLTAYPKNLLTSPLDVTTASLDVRPGGPRLAGTSTGPAVPDGVLTRGADRLTVAFEDLLSRYDGGPLIGLAALLGAILLGAAHAVAPGHGKTIMAFYLSGRREGAFRAAATVGATVTATHTAGVLLLGLLVSAGTAFVPAKVYPWLSVVSGLLVVAVGLTLLRASRAGGRSLLGHTHGTGAGQHTHAPAEHPPAPAAQATPSSPTFPVDHAAMGITALATPRPAETHPHNPVDHAATGILVEADERPSAGHDHGGHDHGGHGGDHEHADHGGHDGHDHDHDGHDHPHAHEIPEPSRGNLIAIGMAGGLLPSPSALLVFLGALALGHAWFGVALVVAFGVGMAATLAVVGLFVMRLRQRVESRLAGRPRSRLAPLLRIAPLLTAIGVVVLGAALAWRGLVATGII